MEMTYNGTLTMPANFAALDAEEMTYVEGGAHSLSFTSRGDAYVFCNNRSLMYGEARVLGAGATTLIGAALGGGGGAALGAILGIGLTDVLSQWRDAWGDEAYYISRLNYNRITIEWDYSNSHRVYISHHSY